MIDNADKQLKQLEGDYKTTFNTKEGIRVLADLESAYYHRSSFSNCQNKKSYKRRNK